MKGYILKLSVFLFLALALTYKLCVAESVDFMFVFFYSMAWLLVIIEVLQIVKEKRIQNKNKK